MVQTATGSKQLRIVFLFVFFLSLVELVLDGEFLSSAICNYTFSLDSFRLLLGSILILMKTSGSGSIHDLGGRH